MHDPAQLESLVAAKSGGPPVVCDPASLPSRLGFDVEAMRAGGHDPAIVKEREAFNQQVLEFAAHPQSGFYLARLTPKEIYLASGIRVLTLESIRDEIQQLEPGSRMFVQEYLPFATSIGGNAVCFHRGSGKVVWADHDMFAGDQICFKDRQTGKYIYLPNTPEHLPQALVALSNDFGGFLTNLLQDRLEAQLDKLD